MAGSFGKRGVQQARAYAPARAAAASVGTADDIAVARAAAATAPCFAPRMDLPARSPAAQTQPPTIGFPIVTVALLVLLTIVYMLEVQHAPTHGPLSARTLAAYGAIEGDLISQHGEWWRLF